jgi:hypothetical protein
MISWSYNNLAWLLTIAAGGVALYAIRDQSKEKAASRTRQIVEATGLLRAHGAALERLLTSQEISTEFKQFLISFSDAIADRSVVAKLAEWLASDRRIESRENTETDYLSSLIEEHGYLRDDLHTVILAGAFGAILRWPESAVLFDQIASRMATNPRSELATALTASKLRSGLTLGLASASPAAA